MQFSNPTYLFFCFFVFPFLYKNSVPLNERLLKHYLLVTGSFIIYYIKITISFPSFCDSGGS